MSQKQIDTQLEIDYIADTNGFTRAVYKESLTALRGFRKRNGADFIEYLKQGGSLKELITGNFDSPEEAWEYLHENLGRNYAKMRFLRSLDGYVSRGAPETISPQKYLSPPQTNM